MANLIDGDIAFVNQTAPSEDSTTLPPTAPYVGTQIPPGTDAPPEVATDAIHAAPAPVRGTCAQKIDAVVESCLPTLFNIFLALAFVVLASFVGTSLGLVEPAAHPRQRARFASRYGSAEVMEDSRTFVSVFAGVMLCYAVFGDDKSAELLDLRASQFPMLFP
eukprot:TRINITY_DN38307_c0_g1_i1.p1 TRINITY_DN38307_c0_g1~~TRINITY_DN38307_c0_g1_i1.p1  ORF type:complete len:188 (+),score=31.45 TRINITY_DN38307_c0_g1_i1:78-566(+)